MADRVANGLVSRLVGAGVKCIYGILGDSMNPVTDAIGRDGRIKWIQVLRNGVPCEELWPN